MRQGSVARSVALIGWRDGMAAPENRMKVDGCFLTKGAYHPAGGAARSVATFRLPAPAAGASALCRWLLLTCDPVGGLLGRNFFSPAFQVRSQAVQVVPAVFLAHNGSWRLNIPA